VENDPLQSASCAEQLKALSEPIRIRIVHALRQGPLAVSDLSELLEAEMVTVSHHLGILKHAGIVEAERDGRFIYYGLREDILQRVKGARPRDYLDFGCCRLELPQSASSK
jgi:DNA-binding transcriptional ArsR family regulator